MKKVLLIFILLFLNNCVLFTTDYYEDYRFLGGESYSNKNESYYNANASIIFHNSLFSIQKIGFLKEKIIYKEPYYIGFEIYGNFEKIENLKAYFIYNKKEIPIPVNAKNMVKSLVSIPSIKIYNKYQFSHRGKTLYIPIVWDEMNSLEVVVKFTGIEKNGKRKEYNFRDTYKKDIRFYTYFSV